jgi:hypothetical protein
LVATRTAQPEIFLDTLKILEARQLQPNASLFVLIKATSMPGFNITLNASAETLMDL